MELDGIGLGGFRSFGDEVQRIGPLAKVNILAGQNNSGKSNVLTFLAHHYPFALKIARNVSADWKLTQLDYHDRDSSRAIAVEFGLAVDSSLYQDVLNSLGIDDRHRERFIPLVERVLRSQSLTHGTALAWFRYDRREGKPFAISRSMISDLLGERSIDIADWRYMCAQLNQGTVTGQPEEWAAKTVRGISPVTRLSEQVELVPAIRRVGDPGSQAMDFSGQGLIDRLAQLERPGLRSRQLQSTFHDIVAFLREVTGNETASLEIPYERDTILVEMDGRLLPISSLGTGVHEVVILAAAASMLRGAVVGIEEPELHLHPVLQRALLRFLIQKTQNQYFITTHSAAILDVPGTAVFHVSMHQGETVANSARTARSRSAICEELGYRASDILQANCIIWVEGPSDRLYLGHWLESLDPTLVEGIHFSIMFYGGRLLSHLTANDPDVAEFISLRRLNRHMVIVMDSDRSSEGDDISGTKKRVKTELESADGLAWVTGGREVENYVRRDVLHQVIRDLHPDATPVRSEERFGEQLRYRTSPRGKISIADKIRVAHKVAALPADIQVLDLAEMLGDVVAFLRRANGLT